MPLGGRAGAPCGSPLPPRRSLRQTGPGRLRGSSPRPGACPGHRGSAERPSDPRRRDGSGGTRVPSSRGHGRAWPPPAELSGAESGPTAHRRRLPARHRVPPPSPRPTRPSSGSLRKWMPFTSTWASPPALTAQTTLSASPPAAPRSSSSGSSSTKGGSSGAPRAPAPTISGSRRRSRRPPLPAAARGQPTPLLGRDARRPIRAPQREY